MLWGIPFRRRVWIFILALIILGGISWADTFDLSDDIPLPLPLTVVEQAIIPVEENREDALSLTLIHQDAWSATPFALQFQILHLSRALQVALQLKSPLYQRFSTYRI